MNTTLRPATPESVPIPVLSGLTDVDSAAPLAVNRDPEPVKLPKTNASEPVPDNVTVPDPSNAPVYLISVAAPDRAIDPDPTSLAVTFSTLVPPTVYSNVSSGGLVVVDSAAPPALNRDPDCTNP